MSRDMSDAPPQTANLKKSDYSTTATIERKPLHFQISVIKLD